MIIDKNTESNLLIDHNGIGTSSVEQFNKFIISNKRTTSPSFSYELKPGSLTNK